jgi:hypothetical protein
MFSATKIAAITLALISACLTFFVLYISYISDLRAIAKNSVAIDGFIVSTDCKNHAVAHYQYTVGSETYRGQDHFDDACVTLNVGNRIHIYYDRLSPKISTTKEPHAAFVAAIISAIFACIFVSSAITLLFVVTVRALQRKKPAGGSAAPADAPDNRK